MNKERAIIDEINRTVNLGFDSNNLSYNLRMSVKRRHGNQFLADMVLLILLSLKYPKKDFKL
jgi:hypothetical protein